MSVAPDVVQWVHEGEQLFGRALQALQRTEQLSAENQLLREQLQVARAELEFFRAERLEAAETLKAIAEQVTRLATVALKRLGKPVA
jgi:hypothetical protein